MKTKVETRQSMVNFIKMVEIQHNTNVKTLRSYNGAEFIMPEFYASKWIFHQTSCVESPQQNGRMERKHQHILNIARALLFKANIPKTFWAFIVSHDVFIINRVPSVVLKNKSTYYHLYNEDRDFHVLKIFGTLTFASTLHAHRTKLDHRGRKCIFLVYKQ